ncbi:hypothetical protein, conserved [Eimeria tenella]|uniref:Uncharacterized protein n=1 Tax=Eimeria tenella TaxID=5802 RepID=U6KLN0_EIMTE|nr:hypothetical protein, conserved [Eimeria tenella]CDJ38901.1 hypothetical protein, conserved [Eimeria tenella]|eukprot:XP_013229656.1 hypothetical protein, conserved [Eimeria tenella]
MEMLTGSYSHSDAAVPSSAPFPLFRNEGGGGTTDVEPPTGRSVFLESPLFRHAPSELKTLHSGAYTVTSMKALILLEVLLLTFVVFQCFRWLAEGAGRVIRRVADEGEFLPPCGSHHSSNTDMLEAYSDSSAMDAAGRSQVEEAPSALSNPAETLQAPGWPSGGVYMRPREGDEVDASQQEGAAAGVLEAGTSAAVPGHRLRSGLTPWYRRSQFHNLYRLQPSLFNLSEEDQALTEALKTLVDLARMMEAVLEVLESEDAIRLCAAVLELAAVELSCMTVLIHTSQAHMINAAIQAFLQSSDLEEWLEGECIRGCLTATTRHHFSLARALLSAQLLPPPRLGSTEEEAALQLASLIRGTKAAGTLAYLLAHSLVQSTGGGRHRPARSLVDTCVATLEKLVECRVQHVMTCPVTSHRLVRYHELILNNSDPFTTEYPVGQPLVLLDSADACRSVDLLFSSMGSFFIQAQSHADSRPQ